MRYEDRSRGMLGFIVTLILFCAGIFLAVRIVPTRIEGYQFRELLRDEVRTAAVHRNDKAAAQRILDAAEAMNIPLDPKNLEIKRSTAWLVISARYEKPIDLFIVDINMPIMDGITLIGTLRKIEAHADTPIFGPRIASSW